MNRIRNQTLRFDSAQRKTDSTILKYIWCIIIVGFYSISCSKSKNGNGENTITDEKIVTIFENFYVTDHYSDSAKLMLFIDSVEQYHGGHEIFQSIRDKATGHYLYRYGDYTQSEKYFDAALEVIRKYKKEFPQYYVLALNNTSEVATKLLKFDEAISYIIEILYNSRIRSTSPDYDNASRLFQLANILYNKGSHLESIDFLKESISALNSYQPSEELDLYNNIFLQFHAQKLLANNFIQIRFFDSAYSALDAASMLIDSILSMDPESNPYLKMSKAELQYLYSTYYIEKNNFEKADSLLENLLSNIGNSIYYNKLRFRASSYLAFTYSNKNKVSEALKIIDSLEAHEGNYIAKRDKLTADFYSIKSRICARAGDYICAYKYRILSSDILDSISTTLLLSNKVNATREYLSLLNKISQENYTSKIQKNKFITLIIVLFSISLIIILTLLYIQTIKNKRHLTQERFLSSELVKKNSELTNVIEQLKESQLYTQFLLKHIAHDLRNPLTGIKGIAEIAQIEDNRKQIDEYLHLIKNQADISINFINYLLKSSSGITEKGLHCINEIADNSIQTIAMLANQKNIKLIKKYSGKHNCFVDFYKIWSLLNNLIGNAIKFSKRGGEVTVSIAKSGSEIIISITDQGVGISKSEIKKILSDKKPEGRAGTEGELSHGIGLQLCKQIIREHDGVLNVVSEEGKGSTFIVILPCGSSNALEGTDTSMEILETS